MPVTLVQTGVTFPDATVQTTASLTGLGGMEIFTSNGTFTIPSGVTKVRVTVVGGGGGANTGGAGTQSRILSGTQTITTVTAGGGGAASGETPGTGGTATNGQLNVTGRNGQQGGYLSSNSSGTFTAQGGVGGEGHLGRGRGASGNSNIRNAGTNISSSGGGGGGEETSSSKKS